MSFISDLMGNQQVRQDVQGFVQRYEQGNPAEGYSDQEVLQRYQQVAPQLSLASFVPVAERALGRLSPQQRSELASMAIGEANNRGLNIPGLPQQAQPQHENPHQLAEVLGSIHQQQPNLLADLLGGSGAIGSTAAKAGLASIAATAAKQLMGGAPAPGTSL